MTTRAPSGDACAPGASAGQDLLDNSYVLGHHGFLYTSNRLPRSTTLRHSAALLISVDHSAFKLSLPAGREMKVAAALVPPRVERTLDSARVPMLSLGSPRFQCNK